MPDPGRPASQRPFFFCNSDSPSATDLYDRSSATPDRCHPGALVNQHSFRGQFGALRPERADCTQLTNISNNILDSSTVGYKEADTNFEILCWPEPAGPTARRSLPALGEHLDGHHHRRSGETSRCGDGYRDKRRRVHGGERRGIRPARSGDAGGFVPARRRWQPGQFRQFLFARPAGRCRGQPDWRTGEIVSALSTVNVDNLFGCRGGHHHDDVRGQPAEHRNCLRCHRADTVNLIGDVLRPAGCGADAANSSSRRRRRRRAAITDEHVDDECITRPPPPRPRRSGPQRWRFRLSGADAGTLSSISTDNRQRQRVPRERSPSPPAAANRPSTYGHSDGAGGITGATTAPIQQRTSSRTARPTAPFRASASAPMAWCNASFSNGVTRPILPVGPGGVSRSGRTDAGRRGSICDVAERRRAAIVPAWPGPGGDRRGRRAGKSGTDVQYEHPADQPDRDAAGLFVDRDR